MGWRRGSGAWGRQEFGYLRIPQHSPLVQLQHWRDPKCLVLNRKVQIGSSSQESQSRGILKSKLHEVLRLTRSSFHGCSQQGDKKNQLCPWADDTGPEFRLKRSSGQAKSKTNQQQTENEGFV